MIEQLREHLILKQNILLKSKSTTIIWESFELKKETHMSELLKTLNLLKKFDFIHGDTSLEQFKAVFSGNKIYNPVEWTHNPSSLRYFINCLCVKDREIINFPLKQKWQITSKCFMKILDGEIYPSKKYKGLKNPKENIQKKIREAVREIS